MKAKDHYKIFLKDIELGETLKAATQNMMKRFLDESAELQHKRGWTQHAYEGVKNEMDLKWQAVAKLDERVHPEVWKEYLAQAEAAI